MKKLSLLFLVASISTFSYAAELRYMITDLGTLGGTTTVAYGVNENGQVVGHSFLLNSGYPHAFVTDSDGYMTDLGTLGGLTSLGYGINDSGQAVGYIEVYEPDYERHAFVRDSDGYMTDLGTLGGIGSGAAAINNSGQIAGFIDTVNGERHIFVMNSDGDMTDLGTLGGRESHAWAINNSGQVTGYSYVTGNSEYHAIITDTKGNMLDLGTLGGTYSRGFGINDSGQVVGDSSIPSGEPHAFVTDSDGAMTDLGTLGGSGSMAWAINNNGQIVGGSYTTSGIYHAYITKSDANMTDLNDLVDNLSSSGCHYLYSAMDISDTGYIIATGLTISGEYHSYLLTPTETTPPVFTVLPQDKTAEATGELTDVELGDVSAIDDSDGLVTIINDAPVEGFPLGRTTVTWTATDTSGNVATATQVITVQDTTAPVLIVPEDITIRANKTLNEVYLGTATATDIFEPVIIVNDAPVEGFPRNSTTVVTWTATDANGNTAIDTQLVTITNKKIK